MSTNVTRQSSDLSYSSLLLYFFIMFRLPASPLVVYLTMLSLPFPQRFSQLLMQLPVLQLLRLTLLQTMLLSLYLGSRACSLSDLYHHRKHNLLACDLLPYIHADTNSCIRAIWNIVRRLGLCVVILLRLSSRL